MENVTDKVKELLIPILDANNFYLVDLEFVKEADSWYLRAYIDKTGGIDIDDCALVSELLSEKLDKDESLIEPAYFLEVSSPGAERPLKSEEDLKNAVGDYIHVSLYKKVEGAKVYEGFLVSIDDDKLELDYKAKNIKKHITLPREIIASTRLAIEF